MISPLNAGAFLARLGMERKRHIRKDTIFIMRLLGGRIYLKPEFGISFYCEPPPWLISSSSAVGILDVATATPPVPPLCVLELNHGGISRYEPYPELRF